MMIRSLLVAAMFISTLTSLLQAGDAASRFLTVSEDFLNINGGDSFPFDGNYLEEVHGITYNSEDKDFAFFTPGLYEVAFGINGAYEQTTEFVLQAALYLGDTIVEGSTLTVLKDANILPVGRLYISVTADDIAQNRTLSVRSFGPTTLLFSFQRTSPKGRAAYINIRAVDNEQ